MKNSSNDYVIRVLNSPLDIEATRWNALLAAQSPDGALNPFMRHEYLAALHLSGSASPETGWTPRFVTLWQGDDLAGASALYLKTHSYGEYVFDHAWANAYQQHGLPYYPKALIAAPFTPVPGARLLARNADERLLLVNALTAWCEQEQLSSLHLLFADDEDVAACEEAGLMLRHTVQFHWTNSAPTLAASRAALPPEGAAPPRGGPSAESAPTLAASRAALPPAGALRLRPGEAGSAAPAVEGEAPPAETSFPEFHRQHSDTRPFRDFDDFLMSLSQEKRKKIRQERRKVAEAGVTFRWSHGKDISDSDWDFFYECYSRTYYEHGNAPYLSRDFFQRMQDTMPENWLLFVAEYSSDRDSSRNGREGEGEDGKNSLEHKRIPVATSLIAISADNAWANGRNDQKNADDLLPDAYAPVEAAGAAGDAGRFAGMVAYGRYWGAVARVDCLHFDACYYQPLAWCIAHGVKRFEGGAQGEHKMARALLPVKTTSAHWLAHPAFANAVERFLDREGEGIDNYMEDLERRSPFKQGAN